MWPASRSNAGQGVGENWTLSWTGPISTAPACELDDDDDDVVVAARAASARAVLVHRRPRIMPGDDPLRR